MHFSTRTAQMFNEKRSLLDGSMRYAFCGFSPSCTLLAACDAEAAKLGYRGGSIFRREVGDGLMTDSGEAQRNRPTV